MTKVIDSHEMAAFDYLSPASNPNLLGHENAERALLQAFGEQNLHHAWLISGPRGIGKATLAYRFAKYVFANFKIESSLLDDDLVSEKLKKTEKIIAMDNGCVCCTVSGGD